MQKKIIAIILTVVLLAAILPFAVTAAEPYEMTFEVGNVTAEAVEGTDVAVPINLTQNSGYISGAMWVEWDKTVLTLDSIGFTDLGPNDGSPTLTDEIKTGGIVKFRLGNSAADEETGKNFEGTGLFMTLNFKVNAGAAAGEYDVKITNADFLDFDPEAPDITSTVVDGKVTLTAGGDTPDPTEPETEPVTEPDPEPQADVIIIADGVNYQASKGDTFNYNYYLNTGEQVCSLDAETLFDIAGLKLLTGTKDYETLFPILKDAVVLNAKQDGRLKYNYSSATGKTFDSDDCVLIHAEFEVTAETGVYKINTTLHAVAGEDEHKYIFNDEVVDDLQDNHGETDLEVYEGEVPTEPEPVVDPTEPQPTEPEPQPTEPETEPETDPEPEPQPTEPETVPEPTPTEPTPTDPTPTEAPTDPSTSPKTGDATNSLMWLILFVACLAGITAVTVIGKRRGVFYK